MNIKRQLTNITCKEYCKKNNYKYSVIFPDKSETVYIPNYIDNIESIMVKKNETTISITHPEIYISELSNVNVLGCTSIVFDDNNYCIYDLPLRDIENRYQLSWASSYYIDRYFTFIDYNDSLITIPEGIMLVLNASFNFWHFNLEILTKLCFINQFKEYNTIPIIIDERIRTIPGFKEELDFLNKLDRPIIYINNAHSYKVTKLIYISDLTIVPISFKSNHKLRYTDIVMDSTSVSMLHENLSLNCTLSRKFFISRRFSPNPRVSNLTEVENIFKENGYEIVNTELLSLNEKQKLFSQAQVIAGTYGAGQTNILFANKNTTIISIHPKSIEASSLSNIAGILGQDCFFIDAPISAYNPYGCNDNFTVDINNLKNILINLRY